MLEDKSDKIREEYQIPKGKYQVLTKLDSSRNWRERFETKTVFGMNEKINRFGTIKYNENFFYEGQLVNGMMHGEGVLYRRNLGILYIGSFKENQFEGKGERFWVNGDYFIGNFVDSLRQGETKE